MGEWLLNQLKRSASKLQAETFALYLAARNPGTPWYTKILVAGIVAYAFSPIDLIPDFVPILGYLDDLVLLPVFITLAIRMVPDSVMDQCRSQAEEAFRNGKPVSRAAGAVVVIIWLLIAALFIRWAYQATMAPS